MIPGIIAKVTIKVSLAAVQKEHPPITGHKHPVSRKSSPTKQTVGLSSHSFWPCFVSSLSDAVLALSSGV